MASDRGTMQSSSRAAPKQKKKAVQKESFIFFSISKKAVSSESHWPVRVQKEKKKKKIQKLKKGKAPKNWL